VDGLQWLKKLFWDVRFGINRGDEILVMIIESPAGLRWFLNFLIYGSIRLNLGRLSFHTFTAASHKVCLLVVMVIFWLVCWQRLDWRRTLVFMGLDE
jgi:hypothetical protein